MLYTFDLLRFVVFILFYCVVVVAADVCCLLLVVIADVVVVVELFLYKSIYLVMYVNAVLFYVRGHMNIGSITFSSINVRP